MATILFGREHRWLRLSVVLVGGFLLWGAGGCGDNVSLRDDGGLDSGASTDAALTRDARPSVDGGLPPGMGRLAVTTLEQGQPVPSRVIVTAVPPTAEVRFDVHPETGQPANGRDGVWLGEDVVGLPDGFYVVRGVGQVEVPHGTYRLFITRGPEYEAVSMDVEVAEGDTTPVDAQLVRTVDTRGWVGVDTHVHSVRSPDSELGLPARVVSEVAAGVSVIVATDHNIITDLQPVVEALGYAQRALAVVGDEFNFTQGHGGAFALPYFAEDEDGGAARLGLDTATAQATSLAAMSARIKALPTAPLVSINHPRMGGGLGYFNNLTEFGPDGWLPPRPLPTAHLFDALEVINGYMRSLQWVEMLLRDWFFLLGSGHRVAALAGSDSHSLVQNTAGYGRTWVRVPTDSVAALTPGDIVQAIRECRTVVSTAPFARLIVDGKEPGETVVAAGGSLHVDLTVDAPSWVSLDVVQLYVNGVKVREFQVTGAARPRFRTITSVVAPSEDGYVVAVAAGKTALPVNIVGFEEAGKVMPVVVTGPVFLDADADGRWAPPLSHADPGPIEIFPGLFGPRPSFPVKDGLPDGEGP